MSPFLPLVVRYLNCCLERRAAPDVWFLADPGTTTACLRACLSPRAPSIASVCQVRPGHGVRAHQGLSESARSVSDKNSDVYSKITTAGSHSYTARCRLAAFGYSTVMSVVICLGFHFHELDHDHRYELQQPEGILVSARAR